MAIDSGLIGYDNKLGLKFIYDITTTNLSFIQTAKDLSQLGIKNNKFFLRLYDPRLVGVDPFSPVLTQEQMQRIILECIRNPWYYLREISRIPEQGSAQGPGSGSKFQLHRANLAATYCFLHNINYYEVIPRQCGKSQSTVSIILWSYLFGTTNSEISFVSKSQKDANDNLKRLKDQKSLLPLFLQQRYQLVDGELKPAKGTDNVQTIENPANHNRIVTKPSSKTVEGADNIGRGTTSPIQWFDEAEFTSHIGYILKASGPAFVQAATNALKNNAPYCRIITSTPGSVDTEPVEETIPVRNYSTLWSDNFYDKTDIELIEYLKVNSSNHMFYIEFSYKQIGQDEEWYNTQCREIQFDRIRIKRDILLQRIRGTSDSPFDIDDLDAINGLKKECIQEVLLNRIYSIRLYEKIKPQVPYIIGVDVSTGTNNDNTAITIIDPYNERAVGEFKSPIAKFTDVATFIRLLLKKVTPHGIVCIERNSLGDAVIGILKMTEASPQLYYDSDAYIVGNPDEKLDEHGFIVREAENRKSYGVYTNTKSREVMMAILMRLVQEKKDAFATEYIINDLNNLIKKASGKIEARSGEHDDNIMSFLIGMYVLYHGKKLYKWGFVRGGTPKDEETLKPMAYEDIYNEMPSDMRELFPEPQPKIDPYQEALRNEIYKAQQARNNFSNTEGVVVTRDDDSIDLNYDRILDGDADFSPSDDDFFKDMNS